MSKPIARAPKPAAFLDRDGTMIVEHGYLGDPELVEPLEGAIEAIRMLNQWGYLVIGVSNQSGIARGYYNSETVDAVNERVIKEFSRNDALINRIYYCSHLPMGTGAPGEADCECRKPQAGMIDWATRDFEIDITQSFVVGDQRADIGLAETLGIPGCLVRTGFGRGTEEDIDLKPSFIADNLLGAVRWWGRRQGHSAH